MTNKFKASKGSKATNINDQDKQLTIEELDRAIEKAYEDRANKMDVIYDMIDTKFDSMAKRYHGMAGLLDVFDAYKRIDDCAFLSEAIEVCQRVGVKVELMQRAWWTFEEGCKEDFNGCRKALEGWLDQWLNPEFVASDPDVMDAVVELCIMSVCQELWELIRRLLEFWDETGKQIEAMLCKMEELKAEE